MADMKKGYCDLIIINLYYYIVFVLWIENVLTIYFAKKSYNFELDENTQDLCCQSCK